MDRITKEQRSRNMSAVKNRGNKTTEIAVVRLLRANKIIGWRRHYNVSGKPDFAFPKQRIAVFVDGCFWHGCKKCGTRPKTNSEFWNKKIEGNMKRDKKVNRELKLKGWIVLRFWEHEIKKDPRKVVQKIENYENNSREK